MNDDWRIDAWLMTMPDGKKMIGLRTRACEMSLRISEARAIIEALNEQLEKYKRDKRKYEQKPSLRSNAPIRR